MKVDVLKNAGIDYDRGVKRFLGRAQIYEKTLRKFAQDTSFSRIQASFEAKDWEAMFDAAHEFKGMCGNIALTSLYDMASALVEMLRNGAPPQAETAEAFQRLQAEYTKIHEAVLAAMEDTI